MIYSFTRVAYETEYPFTQFALKKLHYLELLISYHSIDKVSIHFPGDHSIQALNVGANRSVSMPISRELHASICDDVRAICKGKVHYLHCVIQCLSFSVCCDCGTGCMEGHCPSGLNICR